MGRKRKRRLAKQEKYSKEFLPKPTTMETVIEQADAAVEDRSSQILKSTQPPAARPPRPKTKKRDKVTQFGSSPSSRSYQSKNFKRGRMIWVAYASVNTKGDSLKFKSPSLVPPGTPIEQDRRAHDVAREKAARLMGVKEDDVCVVQVGGYGEYYDEQDAKQELP